VDEKKKEKTNLNNFDSAEKKKEHLLVVILLFCLFCFCFHVDFCFNNLGNIMIDRKVTGKKKKNLIIVTD